MERSRRAFSVAALRSRVRDWWRRSSACAWWPFAVIPFVVAGMRVPGAARAVVPWIWVAVATVLAVSVATTRPDEATLRRSAMLWGWLALGAASLLWSPAPGRGLVLIGSVFVAGLAYAWGGQTGRAPVGAQLRWVGAAGIAGAAGALVLFREPSPVAGLNPNRILAMGLISLTIAAWYESPSRTWVLTTGLAALAVSVASGSRMASVVLLGLLVTAPGLRLPRSARILASLSAVVVVVLALGTPAFQSRWFASGSGDLWDILAVTDNLQTSGRFEVWPEIIDQCDRPVLGVGVGAADSYAQEAGPGFPEPHNEYLRIWCDTGIVGSLLLWGFVALIGVGAVRGLEGRTGRWALYSVVQFVAALVLLSLTDNPLTTVVPFLVPAALMWGWAQSSATHPT